MKTLSLHLIEGIIDEVDSTVQVCRRADGDTSVQNLLHQQAARLFDETCSTSSPLLGG